MKTNFTLSHGMYSVMLFKSGELHIQNAELTHTEDVVITGSVLSSDNLMELLLLVDALRARYPHVGLTLSMPYCAYSRQDRIANTGEALSIKVFANLINSCDFMLVVTQDNHSPVATALLNNCVNIPKETITTNLPYEDYFYLVSPDAGANKQVEALSLLHNIDMIRADKIRDTKTGKITHTEVFCEDLQGADCLIIDDICQGGMTFLKLAEALKERGAGRIALYVTHGFFSSGLESMEAAGIDTFYAAKLYNADIQREVEAIW